MRAESDNNFIGNAGTLPASSPWAQSLFIRMPVPAALALSLSSMAILAWTDYQFGSIPNFAILCAVPVLIAAAAGNVKLLWGMALAAIVVTLSALLVPSPSTRLAELPGIQKHAREINRLLSVFNLIVIAGAMHALIAIHRRLMSSRDDYRLRGEQLEQQNLELASREEEIGRQNEELQIQAEEMERQSEELRVSNDELTRREKMLESLLGLSRELATSTERHQTMERICRNVSNLMCGLSGNVAVGIMERRGDDLCVASHCGFGPEGLKSECWPFQDSFAAMVLSRERTGFINDVSLRPDLTITQPASGLSHRAILAAPLRIGGRKICTLEVYRTDDHHWTDEEVMMIESLAAQTSVSLEASELYQKVDEDQRRLQTILATLPIGVGIVNAELTEVRLNPAGGLLLGLPAEVPITPLQMHRRWQKYREGHLVDLEDMTILKAVQLNCEIGNVEREIVFGDGRRLVVMMTAAPIHDAVGVVVGGVCAYVDITRLKMLQNELDARRREAEESSLRKSRFLAAVSHDIRTPANAISLLAELMSRSASSPSLMDEIPEIAADLKRSALTLVDLVSDVLDLTRFDSGKVDLQETIVSLRDLFLDDCRQFIAPAREKNLELVCEPPAENVQLRVDRVKVTRILGNLISNAIKYTPAGKVTVIAGRDKDGGVSISVADTGSGIPAEHLEDIFDEFFQLKSGSHDRTRGSGLGLAICRRLVEAMAGRISVTSEVDKGSVFTLTLPPTCVVPG